MRVEQVRINNPQTFQHTSSDYYVLTRRYTNMDHINKVVRNFGEPWYKRVALSIQDSFKKAFPRKTTGFQPKNSLSNKL